MGKQLIIKGADWMESALNVLTIGKLFTSLSGVPKSTLSYTYVYKKPVPAGRVLFYYQSETSGTALFEFKVFTKSDNTLTQNSYVAKTVQKNTWVDLGIDVQDGQYLGIFGGDSGIAYEASTDPEIPPFAAASGNKTTVDYTTNYATHFSFLFAIKES